MIAMAPQLTIEQHKNKALVEMVNAENQAGRCLESIWNAGQHFLAIRKQVPHNQWEKWVDDNTKYTPGHMRKILRVAKRSWKTVYDSHSIEEVLGHGTEEKNGEASRCSLPAELQGTAKEVRDRLGVSISTAYIHIRVARNNPELYALVKRGDVPVAAALKILQETPDSAEQLKIGEKTRKRSKSTTKGDKTRYEHFYSLIVSGSHSLHGALQQYGPESRILTLSPPQRNDLLGAVKTIDHDLKRLRSHLENMEITNELSTLQ